MSTSQTVNKKTTNFTIVDRKIFSDGTCNYVWGLELITNGKGMYYLYNAHGDVVQLVFLNSGVVRTYDYDAYGNELERDLSDSNPFRYCGEYYDTETGFIYLRARYYDPSNGRFISSDPAKDGLNWYAYCNNNPVALVDRNGLWVETAWDLISLGMSIYDVCQNPHDTWAWLGLAGDAADVIIPFFGGIGEAIKGSRAIGIVATKTDDVIDAVKAIDKFDDVADAITDTTKTIKTLNEVKDAAEAAEKATGQFHHVLSNPIMKAINNHPTLQKLKNNLDRASSVIQALTKEAHKGYQTWHRNIDKAMVEWLGKYEKATVKQFWEEMYKHYNTKDMIERFGQGVLDYISEMIKKC